MSYDPTERATARAIDMTSATWYAFGRNDAQGTRTDVFAFAEYYAQQRPTRGMSVQDAYTAFTTATPVPPIATMGEALDALVDEPTVAPIADEVRDFLAKSIDDSMADLDAIDTGETAQVMHNRKLGNHIAMEGITRCSCGCKYWEHDRCVDCGQYAGDVEYVDEDANRGDR